MILMLKCQLLEVLADTFQNDDGEEVEFYKAQIWQQGEGVASVSVHKDFAETIPEGEHTFICELNGSKVRIVGVDK